MLCHFNEVSFKMLPLILISSNEDIIRAISRKINKNLYWLQKTFHPIKSTLLEYVKGCAYIIGIDDARSLEPLRHTRLTFVLEEVI